MNGENGSADQLEMWDSQSQKCSDQPEITVEEMQSAVAALKELKEAYSSAKKLSDDAYAVYKDQQEKVVEMLQATNSKSFVSDHGKVTLVEKMSVKVPKTLEEKEAFFNWVEKNMGEDARVVYATINSATLNRLYNEQSEEAAARGEVLSIDGISEPNVYTTLSFKK
jgi:hypothetical protein